MMLAMITMYIKAAPLARRQRRARPLKARAAHAEPQP
jgi:hypothetical protein